MVEYAKPWLSLDQQVERLAARGVDVGSRERAVALLAAVGYYRLTGYLYPFRQSERVEGPGVAGTRVLRDYRPGTSLEVAADIIDFDRALRVAVMDGVERIEVAVRMRVGYVLGQRSTFAHEDPELFVPAFVEPRLDEATARRTAPSKHVEWLQRVAQRRDGSSEAFVAHFRDRYDNRMPIWALTEVLELGQLSRLYGGLVDDLAVEVATAFGVPTKTLMSSWLASLNYVRNVAAHHARLFNKRLQHAPRRPRRGTVPLLDHLRDGVTPEEIFGVYNALAVVAYLLRSFDPDCDWAPRMRALVERFPSALGLTARSLGVPQGWSSNVLWQEDPPAPHSPSVLGP